MSSNKFINQGIEVVKEAIRLDNEQQYEGAYAKYKSSLNYFMTGLKHEQNQSVKDTILKRVTGYMDRAEALKAALDAQKGGGGGRGGGVRRARRGRWTRRRTRSPTRTRRRTS